MNYHIEGVDADQYAYHTSGIKSLTWIASQRYCARISTVSVGGPLTTSSDAQFVEFGWVLGDPLWGGRVYTPQLFMAYSLKGEATVHYWLGRTLSETEVMRTMSLQDTNMNTVWGGYYGGYEEHVVNVDFSFGTAITNGERKNPGDNGYAKFYNLQEYHENGGWSAFDNVQRYGPDYDPGFDFHRVAADSHTVRAD